jgi:hypothetical protein
MGDAEAHERERGGPDQDAPGDRDPLRTHACPYADTV